MKMPPFDKKKLQMIAVAIVMGIVAIFLVNKYTEERIVNAVDQIARSQQLSTSKESVDAVVAIREINRGREVEKGMLTVRKIPAEFLQPGTFPNIEAAIGKTAAVDILPGEQITATKLGTPGSVVNQSAAQVVPSSLALKTPQGKRAVTIPMDSLSAAGGMVRPGDYVDIIGNFPVPQMVDGKITSQLATVTLFQNVLVLAVSGSFGHVEQPAAQIRGPRGEQMPAPQAYTPPGAAGTITFALPPKEAELLLFAYQQGKLTLILRAPLETATSAMPVATWDSLLQYILSQQGQTGAPTKEVTPQQALQQRVLEIYKAGNLEKREEKTLPVAK